MNSNLSGSSVTLAEESEAPIAVRRAPAPLLESTAFVFATQVVILGCAVANNLLVAALMGPAGKGLVYLIQFISGGVGLAVLNFGFGPASVYYLGQERGYSQKEIASALLWPSIVLGALPLAVLWPLWHWWRPVGLSWLHMAPVYLWLALACIPPIVLWHNVGFFCLGMHRVRTYNLLRLAPPSLFALTLLALAVTHRISERTASFGWLFSVIVPAVASAIVLTQAGASLVPRLSRFAPVAMRFGFKSHLGAVAQYLQHRVDILLVSAFLPLQSIGIYSLAVSMAEILWYVPQATSTVLMPQVASRSAEDAHRVTSMFCRASLATTAVLAVSVGLFSQFLIPRYLPAFNQAVGTFWILLPGVVLATIFKVLWSDFNGRGMPMRTVYPAAISALLALAAGAYVVPHYGLKGAAIITTVGYGLNAAIYLYLYAQVTKAPFSDLLVLRPSDARYLANAARALLRRRRAEEQAVASEDVALP